MSQVTRAARRLRRLTDGGLNAHMDDAALPRARRQIIERCTLHLEQIARELGPVYWSYPSGSPAAAPLGDALAGLDGAWAWLGDWLRENGGQA